MVSPKLSHKTGVLLLFIADIFVLISLFYLSSMIRKFVLPMIFDEMPVFALRIRLYYWTLFIWMFFLIYSGAYTRRFSLWDEVRMIWKVTLFSSLAIFAVLFIGKHGHMLSRALMITFSFISFCLFPCVRVLVKKLLYRFGLLKRKVLIYGSGKSAASALKSIQNEPNLGYEVAGFVDDSANNSINGMKVHKLNGNLDRYIKNSIIHDLLIAKPELNKKDLTNIINNVQHKVDNILYLPDLSGVAVLGTELRYFFDEQTMVIEIKNNLARPMNYFIKRSIDLIIGLLLLFILAIPLAIISILIRLTSRGPAIYSHTRIGKKGKPFVCYKFRTMHVDAEDRLKEILEGNEEAREEYSQFWKLKNDPRITSIGGFLRDTSLDELPQIINVVKGEMSLIGPRPYLTREWNSLKDHHETILNVPPGITGLWQVSGRSDKTYNDRLMLDSWYVRNWSLWLDFIILFKTIVVVIKKEGAR